MPGRSWRAGKPCGDGKPEGPDRPLEKGVGGINKASSDAGPELAGREGPVAMESPKALMCPLEKGVRGIEIEIASGFGTESQ